MHRSCCTLVLPPSAAPLHHTPPAPTSFQAEADELNYILCTINAPAMVEVRPPECMAQHCCQRGGWWSRRLCCGAQGLRRV